MSYLFLYRSSWSAFSSGILVFRNIIQSRLLASSWIWVFAGSGKGRQPKLRIWGTKTIIAYLSCLTASRFISDVGFCGGELFSQILLLFYGKQNGAHATHSCGRQQNTYTSIVNYSQSSYTRNQSGNSFTCYTSWNIFTGRNLYHWPWFVERILWPWKLDSHLTNSRPKETDARYLRWLDEEDIIFIRLLDVWFH